MTKAILDLGTNTFHLLIGTLVNNKLNVLVDEKLAVKIGEKGMMAGIITAEAQQRAIETLLFFKTIIESFPSIEQIQVIATSAFRNANNALNVCEAIYNNTGFEVRIISGDQEAKLIYEGVKLSGALQQDPALIVDIGGGSVEFIICNQHNYLWKQSFDIGGLRLMERFHHSDPILPEEINAIEQHLHQELTDLHEAVLRYKPTFLLGSSGAFDTYIDIHYTQQNFPVPNEIVHSLPLDSFMQMHYDFITKTKAERLAMPGMIPLRAEMIVVASCLTKFLLQNYQLNNIVTSRFALKEGAFVFQF